MSRAFELQAAGAQLGGSTGPASVCLVFAHTASLGGSVGLVLLGTVSGHSNLQRMKGTFSAAPPSPQARGSVADPGVPHPDPSLQEGASLSPCLEC